MHYNNLVELISTRYTVNLMEDELRALAEEVGIRMLNINKRLGLLDARIPKRLELDIEYRVAYDRTYVYMCFDIDTDHKEYILVPIEFIFDAGWELKYIEQQEPKAKAKMKINAQDQHVELLKKFYGLMCNNDNQGN